MNYAGFFTRFIAWFLDGIIASILLFIFTLILSPIIAALSGGDGGLLGLLTGVLSLILILFLWAFQFVYFGYFWSKSGQSLGMKLLNIKVVRSSEDLPISFIRGGLRGTVGYWISAFVFGLGYIWAAFDADKEAWHDKIFDTWVVQA